MVPPGLHQVHQARHQDQRECQPHAARVHKSTKCRQRSGKLGGEANGVQGYKEALLRTHEDGTTITRAYTGKTCRVIENGYTKAFEADGGVPEPFPMQVVKTMQEGANHLGGDPTTEGVDPDKEFWPAGQGVGSINEIVPAGELVQRFVREAEDALGVVQRSFA